MGKPGQKIRKGEKNRQEEKIKFFYGDRNV